MTIVDTAYRVELAELIADPIIAGMAEDLRAGIAEGAITLGSIEGFDFMRAASERYRSLGGTKARTIGGPLLALQVTLGIKDEAGAFA